VKKGAIIMFASIV